MEWWQLVGMAGTIVATSTAVVALGWRVLEKMRAENRTAHDKIGKSISELRSDLTRDIGAVRNDLDAKIDTRIRGLREELSRDIQSLGDRLGAEIATNRQGMVAVGEALAELRGELRGVNRSLQDLREDFRIHVYWGERRRLA